MHVRTYILMLSDSIKLYTHVRTYEYIWACPCYFYRNILVGLFFILPLMCGILILGLFALNSDATEFSWIFALLTIALVCSILLQNCSYT